MTMPTDPDELTPAEARVRDVGPAAFDSPPAGELASIDGDRRNDREVLEANGYVRIRDIVFQAPAAVAGVAPGTFDAVIGHAERAARSLRAAGAPDEHVRAAEEEAAILRACKRFARDLESLRQRAAARERLTGR